MYLHDRYRQKGRVSAYYTPMIGPYDSVDRDTIRLQLKLMKLAGVQGISLNWYGIQNRNDYPVNLARADAIINETVAAGLLWTVNYEDATMDSSKSTADQLLDLKADWEYMRDNYINKLGHVLRLDGNGTSGRPVFTVFGPRTFSTPSTWSDMLADVFPNIEDRPYLLGVDTGGSASLRTPDGDFHWPGYTLFDQPETTVSLVTSWTESFYSKAQSRGYVPIMGTAFPRFQDYYLAGSAPNTTPDSWWSQNVTSLGGQTIAITMRIAHEQNAHSVQIATWNDIQEGTQIEPTAEEGFTQLLNLQKAVLGYEDDAPMLRAVQEYNNLKASTWQYCDNVDYVDREACPTSASTESTCEAAGCCWRDTTQSGVPNCFARASEPVCECRTDLRDCERTPQDRLCCCKHAYSPPPHPPPPDPNPPPAATPSPPEETKEEPSMDPPVATTVSVLAGSAASVAIVGGVLLGAMQLVGAGGSQVAPLLPKS